MRVYSPAALGMLTNKMPSGEKAMNRKGPISSGVNREIRNPSGRVRGKSVSLINSGVGIVEGGGVSIGGDTGPDTGVGVGPGAGVVVCVAVGCSVDVGVSVGGRPGVGGSVGTSGGMEEAVGIVVGVNVGLTVGSVIGCASAVAIFGTGLVEAGVVAQAREATSATRANPRILTQKAILPPPSCIPYPSL